MSMTGDLDDFFFAELPEVAKAIGAHPIDLLSVMMSESGIRSDAHNPTEGAHAVGIIQFMPATLKGLGYKGDYESFRHLTASNQLMYVQQYFSPYAKKSLDSKERLYMATFLPVTLDWERDEDGDLTLVQKGGRLGWAYSANAGFDTNKDLKIRASELGQAITRNCKGARWNEAVTRLGHTPDFSEDDHETFDLRTVRGIQEALTHLGGDPGPIDGIPGPKTVNGVIEFQKSSGLKPDGIVGPLTRAALEEALTA